MPRPMSRPEPLALPPEPDPEKLPRFADRPTLARIHTHYFGPQSHRTLETWPLTWRRVNGRAVSEVRAFLVEAQRRFDAAPVIRGGGRHATDRRAECQQPRTWTRT
jgi:hypothetical protein